MSDYYVPTCQTCGGDHYTSKCPSRMSESSFAAPTGLAALFQSIKTMTTHEQTLVAQGGCPHCDATLRVLGTAGETKWHQCHRCLAVWVIAANDQAHPTATDGTGGAERKI